jgi:predicted nuclease of predicted toxin-antitoxin system
MLRLITDVNIEEAIYQGLLLRQPDLDIISVQDVGLPSADDPALLDWAASKNRIMVTHDRNTMIRFAYDRILAGLPMPGLFVLRDDLSIGQTIQELLVRVLCSEHEEWKNWIEFIP